VSPPATTTRKVSPPTTATRKVSPPAAAASAVTKDNEKDKEIDDLKAKLRALEKKRIEDREKINALDKVQSERDRFERIIQTLQIKYQPQQQEIADLRKQLKEAEARFHNVERIQEEHESAMELATLDREMAEEMADVYKTELDALKQKNEELELELEILREENAEFTKGLSSEEKASTGWLQMEKNNERLREALIRLRDISREQEEELKAQIKGLQDDLTEFDSLKEQFNTCKADLAQKESTVEDLREQLDNALGAEEIIENLTEQTINQSEKIKELQANIAHLEDLKEISEELEINHVENEKELHDIIDKKDAIIAEQARQLAIQNKSMDDMEYTLSRFRELVTSLQSDLADMRASHAVTENESEQLNNRSRAMLDLNMKLQISAAKAQVKTIDLELRRMEAQEAEQHLEIVTMFLPDTYHTDRVSVLALLRFKRLASKADILNGFIKERINGQPHPGHENEIFDGCSAMDKLAWVSCMCDRFINSISHCSLEQFTKYDGAFYELEPVERALNGWIDGLKRNDLKEKQCADELQRTIALMTHLGEVHLSNDLESFADDIHMKAQLMQTHLESAAVSFATTAAMVHRVVTEDEDELTQHFAKKTEAVVTQTRSAKVIAGKTVRALEDLKTRSLSLLPETLEVCQSRPRFAFFGPFRDSTDLGSQAFEQCETATAELADMSRRIGLDLHQLLHEEGRTEPFTIAEVETCAQKTAMAAFNSTDSDLFSTYLNRLRVVTSQISDLAALSTDLSQTQEFERSPAPWVLRSQELKALKNIPIEAEAETRRLKDDLNNARRSLAIREEDLSTAQLKIETLESRMRDAKAKASRISELESQIDAAKEHVATLSESIEKQDRELKALELECDRWKQVANSNRVAAGSSAEGGEAGTKANQERAVATAREITTLRTEIDGLQASVRYLRELNRRARTIEQASYDWLAEPLAKNVPPAEQRKASIASESRAVLGELVNLASSAKVFDMASLPADKVAWKPAKSTPQYHAAKQMEDYGTWKGWQLAAIRKGKVGGAPAGGRAVSAARLKIRYM
jgi:dynactin 1